MTMLDSSSCLPKLYFPPASSECVPQSEVFVASKGAITIIIHVYKTPEDWRGNGGSKMEGKRNTEKEKWMKSVFEIPLHGRSIV
jgi:hypothetical protein